MRIDNKLDFSQCLPDTFLDSIVFCLIGLNQCFTMDNIFSLIRIEINQFNTFIKNYDSLCSDELIDNKINRLFKAMTKHDK